ncbi:MAG: hypothetical protein M3Q58_01920, partial [Bacteroidota bacterium]|nr:hypothetical protein [Bacteroidota bacterium]
MHNIYIFNQDSCSYEQVKKPFIMHNLMLLALMFTSVIFFILTCYYHAQNEKTLNLAPVIAKNCYTEVDSLRTELLRQKKQVQLFANLQYLMKNATLNEPPKKIKSDLKSNASLILIPNNVANAEVAYTK